jgi:glycosyltransferase involved in cell wall biosynthesis
MALAQHHEVWVLTRSNNEASIHQAVAAQSGPAPHFIYLDLPQWLRTWKHGNRGIHLYYYLWQVAALWTARRWHRRVRFDLTHHLTFGIDWLPSFLAALPVPHIWGPIIGAGPAPWRFQAQFPLPARAREVLRAAARRLSLFDPFLRAQAKHTTVAIVSSLEAGQRLEGLGCRKIQMQPSVGLTPDEIQGLAKLPRQFGNPRPIVLSISNIYAFKGLGLALEALARYRQRGGDFEWWVIGDGPDLPWLRGLVASRGAHDWTRFFGRVDRRQVLRLLGSGDVFLYPCLRGAVSMACLEAMAVGIPVVCLDTGGVALQVPPDAGIKVPLTRPLEVVTGLSTAMERLCRDPGLRLRLGARAKAQATAHASWKEKAKAMSSLYWEAI